MVQKAKMTLGGITAYFDVSEVTGLVAAGWTLVEYVEVDPRDLNEVVTLATRLDLRDDVGADNGDADATIVAGTDEGVQPYATELTANRTVTLSTTGAENGDKFKVVRTGLGSFTLDVGGLKTIASATAATVEVAFNGTAWILIGYQAL